MPEGDRTFFKENVDDPEVLKSWVRPGAARALAVEGDRVVGYMAVVPLQGWSSHVGEVRVIVDPDARGRGYRASARTHAVLEALQSRPDEDDRRGGRRSGVDDRDVPVARVRPEALLVDQVRDRPVTCVTS